MRKGYNWLLVLVMFIHVFCYSNVYSQKIEIVDGVRIIHNEKPLYENDGSISLEFVHKIGGLDETDEDYLLYKPMDVALDAQGNIYVADAGNYRIQKYDLNGKFLATFGKYGQGPNEYQNPRSIDVDKANNEVYVVDTSNRRITVVSIEGKEIRTFKLNNERRKAMPFKFLPNGLILSGISSADFAPIDDLSVKPVFKVYDRDGALIYTFGKTQDFQDVINNSRANIVSFAFDNNSNIYVAFRHQNRIEKYTSKGELLFSATRRLNYELVYPRSTIDKDASGVIHSIRVPSLTTVSRGMGLDAKERIWVLTAKKQVKAGEPSRVRILLKYDDPSAYVKFEIFSNEGILLYELPFNEDFTPGPRFHMFGDRVFFRDSDETAIYEYKVIG